MEIGKLYKIGSDALNIILYKKHVSKKSEKEHWEVEGYFSTVQNALDFLLELKVRQTHLKDLQTVVKQLGNISELIQKTLQCQLQPTKRQRGIKPPSRVL